MIKQTIPSTASKPGNNHEIFEQHRNISDSFNHQEGILNPELKAKEIASNPEMRFKLLSKSPK